MMISKYKVVAILGLLIFITAVGLWYFQLYRPRVASDLVSVTIMLAHPDTPLEAAKELVPKAILIDREFTVIYLFLKADEIDGSRYSAAKFWLALHLLDQDCDVAEYYLESYLEVVGTHPMTERLLKIIRASGCEQASEEVAKWISADEPLPRPKMPE